MQSDAIRSDQITLTSTLTLTLKVCITAGGAALLTAYSDGPPTLHTGVGIVIELVLSLIRVLSLVISLNIKGVLCVFPHVSMSSSSTRVGSRVSLSVARALRSVTLES